MRDTKGFTLIELLIVVVIIGILAAIAIPKFSATREKAYFAAMKSDLKNLASQQEIYYSDAYSYTTATTDLAFTNSDAVNVSIGASVGIAIAPQDGDTPDLLMKNADLALHRAKSEGRGMFQFFERGIDAAMRRRREIEAGLRARLLELVAAGADVVLDFSFWSRRMPQYCMTVRFEPWWQPAQA